MRTIVLGVAADDFTGASDAASFLAEAGVPTVLYNGIPADEADWGEGAADCGGAAADCGEAEADCGGAAADCGGAAADCGGAEADWGAATPGGARAVAAVIALKTRTAPAEQAVEETMAAFDWLKRRGASQLYFKYCSTFDSTPQGNIGPVADAALKAYGLTHTVICPSLPVNGRTVRGGRLYVDGVPLAESHMKDHPLTPMRCSELAELMEGQSRYGCLTVETEQLGKIGEKIAARCRAGEVPFYVIPDYYEEEHGDRIAEIFGSLPFLTGGSGLIGALGRRYAGREGFPCGPTGQALRAQARTMGRALLLAGSCSAVTLRQIAHFQKTGRPCRQISVQRLMDGEDLRGELLEWMERAGDGCLIYSSAAPDDIRRNQTLGRDQVAAAIEGLLSGLAAEGVRRGFRRLIVAGGETSGAVTKALGYSAFQIGPSVAPGVPVMSPCKNPELRLVLKSGNFGQEDFFTRALEMTGSSGG